MRTGELADEKGWREAALGALAGALAGLAASNAMSEFHGLFSAVGFPPGAGGRRRDRQSCIENVARDSYRVSRQRC